MRARPGRSSAPPARRRDPTPSIVPAAGGCRCRNGSLVSLLTTGKRTSGGATLGRIIRLAAVLGGFAFEHVEALLEILRHLVLSSLGTQSRSRRRIAGMKNPGAVSRIATPP